MLCACFFPTQLQIASNKCLCLMPKCEGWIDKWVAWLNRLVCSYRLCLYGVIFLPLGQSAWQFCRPIPTSSAHSSCKNHYSPQWQRRCEAGTPRWRYASAHWPHGDPSRCTWVEGSPERNILASLLPPNPPHRLQAQQLMVDLQRQEWPKYWVAAALQLYIIY